MKVHYKDYCKNNYHVTEYTCYIIEAYWRKWDMWMDIGSDTYGVDGDYGEFTSCGECWQKTGHHGTFSKEHAIEVCRQMNEQLQSGEIIDYVRTNRFEMGQATQIQECGLEKFRVKEIRVTYKQRALDLDVN